MSDDNKTDRRGFLGAVGKFSAAAIAGTALTSLSNEVDAAPLQGKEYKAKVVKFTPIADQTKVSALEYDRSYNKYYNDHKKILEGMANTVMKPRNGIYPIMDEEVPGYARFIRPAGAVAWGGPIKELPSIMLATNKQESLFDDKAKKADKPKEKQTVAGTISDRGVEVAITINEDGAGFNCYGGMRGCEYQVERADGMTSAWKHFPPTNPEQQKLVLPPEAKKGDIVHIRVPLSIVKDSADQLLIYPEYQRNR